jgi:hypothetical protein
MVLLLSQVLSIIERKQSLLVITDDRVGERPIVQLVGPPVAHCFGKKVGEPGADCSAMGHNGDLPFRMLGHDLIQRLSDAVKEGLPLFPAWKFKAKVVPVLPVLELLRHGLAKRIHVQTVDLAKVNFSKLSPDCGLQAQVLANPLCGLHGAEYGTGVETVNMKRGRSQSRAHSLCLLLTKRGQGTWPPTLPTTFHIVRCLTMADQEEFGHELLPW